MASSAKHQKFGLLLSLNPSMEHIELTKREVVFGRNAKCDIVFDDLQVSKQHCKLMCTPDGVFVQDLSTNGTWLNRTSKIGPSNIVPLRNGDELSLVLPRSRHQVFGEKIVSYVFQDLSQPTADVIVQEIAEAGIQQAYTFMKELGAGSFGTVWLASNKTTKQHAAVKVINKKKFVSMGGKVEQMFTEVTVMDKLSHPNIVDIRNVYDTPSYLVLVLELATGGDLGELITKHKRLSERAARLCFHQIITALSYLHEQGVVHRDLKPENILLAKRCDDGKTTPKLLLSDFGLAKNLGKKAMTTTVCGTPLYIAPEVIVRGMAHWGGYGAAVDMWAAGLILYQMLCGALPFRTDAKAEPLHRQISYALRPDFHLLFPDFVSKPVQDLINRLVCSPQHRLTAAQALKHPWLAAHSKRTKRPRTPTDDISRMKTLASSEDVVALAETHKAGIAANGAGGGAGAAAAATSRTAATTIRRSAAAGPHVSKRARS